MNSNVLKNEDITEKIIAFNLCQSYHANITKTSLYDCTRGYWNVSLENAQQCEYAFSIYKSTIKEVYKIEKWLPSEEIRRETFPNEQNESGKYGFEGKIAKKEIRDRYLEKSVENICKKGFRFKYLPIHDKNNDEVIEETKKIEKEVEPLNIDEESKKAIVNVRVNQGKFRDLLLKRYNNKCCLCDVKNKNFLIASHIKPWAKSKSKEKADIDNGFLLCPNHDRLFDKGYITFEDDGTIIISGKLEKDDMISLNVDSKMHIEQLTKGNKEYLKFHRKKVFDS
ncbi:MAG: hypothetical protein HDT40_04865 [Lachnospiraceae bacterium]|nr:hypothetical protein [Lachnospiraceae bacterium]